MIGVLIAGTGHALSSPSDEVPPCGFTLRRGARSPALGETHQAAANYDTAASTASKATA